MTAAAPEALGLLAGICERPDDYLARLVYADWLDDNGQSERAEFIRVQCELPSLVGAECVGFSWHTAGCNRARCNRSSSLKYRQRHLLDARGYGWCDGLFGEDWKADGGTKGENVVAVRYFRGTEQFDAQLTFSRGFVSRVRAPFAVLQARLPDLVRVCPLEGARATDCEPCVQQDDGVAHWHLGRLGLPPETSFPNAELAHEALSLALIDAARAAAKLPPLTRPAPQTTKES